jgi:hypothetical protein
MFAEVLLASAGLTLFTMACADQDLETVTAGIASYSSTLRTLECTYKMTWRPKGRGEPTTTSSLLVMKDGKILHEDLTLPDDRYQRLFVIYDGEKATTVTAIKGWPVRINVTDVPSGLFRIESPLTFLGLYLPVKHPTPVLEALSSSRDVRVQRVSVSTGDAYDVSIPYAHPGNPQPLSLFKYLIDPDRDYLPVSIELHKLVDGAISGLVWRWEITCFQTVPDPASNKIRWFPAEAISKLSDGTNLFEVDLLHINHDIPDHSLSYAIPEGASVYDDVRNRHYIQGGMEARQRVLDGAAAQAIDAGGVPLVARRPNYLGRATLTLGVLSLLLFSAALWRRMTQRRARTRASSSSI